VKKFSKTILGFYFYGTLDKVELSYAWRRGLIPEHFDLSICSYFFPYINNLVDIGANSGLYCLTAANYNKIEVFAFEPQNECIKDLNETKKLNKWSNLTVENYALSDNISEIKLYRSGSTTGTTALANNMDYITSKTISLDSYFPAKIIDFIKIDVEGFELEVLKGTLNIIKAYHPIIFIELLKKTLTKEESLRLLIDNQYEIYVYNVESKQLESFNEKKFKLIDMYLCINKESIYHINNINKLILNKDLLYLPFKYSQLSLFQKKINYNLLKFRYYIRNFLK
jgi:FkbM family methyltransferase